MKNEQMDRVFLALSKSVRRRIIESLIDEPGQSLTKISELSDISRQSFSQHLLILKEAGLVLTRRSGRETLHYANPIPLLNVQVGWLARFDSPEARALLHVRDLIESPKQEISTKSA